MAKLLYSITASLDGFVADEHGGFDWAAPDEEVHRFVNDLERSVGTFLLGRRMYETLAVWEDMHNQPDQPDVIYDFAKIWRSVDKVVYSRSLHSGSTARTRIESAFDPDFVRELKSTSGRDLSIGGPELAAQALAAGLVDEVHLIVAPVVIGRGNRFLREGLRADLQLSDQRRFGNGMVYLGYRVLNN